MAYAKRKRSLSEGDVQRNTIAEDVFSLFYFQMRLQRLHPMADAIAVMKSLQIPQK